MGVDAVRQAPDQRVLVGLLRELGQQFADEDAVDVGRDRLVELPAVVVAGGRLRVERVEVRRAAPEPDLDDGLSRGPRAARQRVARRQQESAALERPRFRIMRRLADSCRAQNADPRST